VSPSSFYFLFILESTNDPPFNKEEWINNLIKGRALQLEIDPSVCLKQQKTAKKAKFMV